MKITTVCLLSGLIIPTGLAGAETVDPAAIARGRYLLRAGGCESCHTDLKHDGPYLAGGYAMKTPFGTFHTPNITPDPQTGLGRWTLADFRRAMIEGTRPDGSPYYPVFPYRWYTGMTQEDIADLWAYLRSVEPVHNPVPPHDLPFPFNIRPLLMFWKMINFVKGKTVHDPERSAPWNRGAYLVNHLGHCGACHTPNILGTFLSFEFLAGSGAWQVPGPYPAPNITSDPQAGIGDWSAADIARAMRRSMRPDGTPIRGLMAEYVLGGSSFLSDQDLAAIAVYLLSVPAEQNRVEAQPDPRQIARPAKAHGSSAVRSLMTSGASRTRAK